MAFTQSLYSAPSARPKLQHATLLAAMLACAGIVSARTPVVVLPAVPASAELLVNIIDANSELAADKTLMLSVLANMLGPCDKMNVDIDAKKMELTNIKFPLADFPILHGDAI